MRYIHVSIEPNPQKLRAAWLHVLARKEKFRWVGLTHWSSNPGHPCAGTNPITAYDEREMGYYVDRILGTTPTYICEITELYISFESSDIDEAMLLSLKHGIGMIESDHVQVRAVNEPMFKIGGSK